MLDFSIQFYMISFLSFGIQTVLAKLQAEFCSEFKLSLPSELPSVSVGICSRLDFSVAVFSCGFSFGVERFNSLETCMLCYNWAIMLFLSLSRCSLVVEQQCNHEAWYFVT